MTINLLQKLKIKNPKKLIINSLINLTIIIVIIIAVDIWRSPDKKAIENLQLTTIDNKNISLHTNQPLLVYIWADWCVYCHYTSPAINKLYKQGINVITIAMQSGDDKNIKNYLAKNNWNFPVVNDQEGIISEQIKVKATPTIAILNKGKMRAFTSGFTSIWGLKLRLFWAKFI